MSLAVRYAIGEIAVGDTAELYAALREREGIVSADEIANVEYTIQKPNGELDGPIKGSVEDDGQGYLQWTETEETGPYLAQAQFTLIANNEKRSVMVNFTVEDPFEIIPNTPQAILSEEVWFRLEDAFDSVEGGPYLRDWTLANFDRAKIARFIPETLLDINVQMHPTTATIADFVEMGPEGERPYLPLLAKGVLCKTIQHMVRSYVEQPIPQGGQVVYEDRTKYAEIWKAVYQDEHKDYQEMVRLWKRGFLNLGKSALLISSKAGRLYFAGDVMRTRNVGRGWF
jgi:hypothetical protein